MSLFFAYFRYCWCSEQFFCFTKVGGVMNNSCSRKYKVRLDPNKPAPKDTEESSSSGSNSTHVDLDDSDLLQLYGASRRGNPPFQFWNFKFEKLEIWVCEHTIQSWQEGWPALHKTNSNKIFLPRRHRIWKGIVRLVAETQGTMERIGDSSDFLFAKLQIWRNYRCEKWIVRIHLKIFLFKKRSPRRQGQLKQFELAERGDRMF